MNPQYGWTGPEDNLELLISVGVVSCKLFNKYAGVNRSTEESIYMSSKRCIVQTKAANLLSHMGHCLCVRDTWTPYYGGAYFTIELYLCSVSTGQLRICSISMSS